MSKVQSKMTLGVTDIKFIMSETVDIQQWQEFEVEIEQAIVDGLDSGMTSGKEELFYTNSNGFEIDVDVEWIVINWKQIATNLYTRLKSVGRWYAGDEAEAAIKEYEDNI